MKKAKRLLAVLMAMVMLLSGVSINVYAYTDVNNYFEPYTSRAKFYLDYEKGCGWLLDMLDELLAEANLTITCNDLNDMVDIGLNLFTSDALLNLDNRLEDAGNPKGLLDLRSVDGIIRTLAGAFDLLDGGWGTVAGAVLGDLLDSGKGLNSNGFDLNMQRHKVADSKVLEMLVNWLGNQSNLLSGIVSGTFNAGSLLKGTFNDLLTDLTGYTGGDTMANMDYALMTLLYGMLIDDSNTAVDQATFDAGVQKLVNWALIEGTGMTAAEGANSILGANFEPLMGEALAKQPGGATLTAVQIQADHDLDGVPETHTMSFYQLVNNVIRALLDEMVVPLLTDVLCDALDVEITEDQPYGDPEILNDQMFSMIIGLVESLLVQNGAPEPVYTEDQNTYPLLKIQAMLDWLFNKGGLDTFILIDYQGIHLQDNLMSLLNDLIRLLVNMLPSLGLFADSAHLGFEGDELTAIWYYAVDENGNKILVEEDAEGAVDQTYLPYEDSTQILYATGYEEVNGVTVATGYNYLTNDMPVNISDKSGANYFNPDFIRSNYVVETDKVYATVIKMALNDMIDGCYFPEWADDIPSVLAYAAAGVASQALPQNNYYARLDAYHEMQVTGAVSVVDGNNNVIDAIPYTAVKRIKLKDVHGNQTGTEDVVVPKGALDILCSYLAAYLNNVLMLNKSMILSTDSTLEKFATQFFTWALDQYMPVLVGYDTNGNGVYGESGEYPGLWTADFNRLLSTVYSNVGTLEFRDDVETYTSEGVMKIDAIYDLLDATLFSLIPTSWLPDINTSSQMINSWLLGNLIEFDLIGILDLLTVNMDYENGELNQPALTVIMRVIDRVFGLVFNGNSVLIPTRNNVFTDGFTSVKTLGELLSSRVNGSQSTSGSLPQLIARLLAHLRTYRYELLATALPLLAGMDYIRSFKEDGFLESSMKQYKVEDLENFVDSLSSNMNATKILTISDLETAEALVNGKLQVKRNAAGTAYDVVLPSNDTTNENNVYASFASKAEADALVNSFKDTYIEEVVVTEATAEEEAVLEYNIWRRWSYLEIAKDRADAYDEEKKGTVTTFSNFKFANLNNRTASNPFVSLETDQFMFQNYEDFGKAGYWYTGANDALKGAAEYASTYRSFSENDLSSAYHDWFMYSIESQLYNKGLFDSNDDGVITTTDITDADGNVVNSADGEPGIPSAMYPYYTSTSSSYKFIEYTNGSYYTSRDDNGAIKHYNTINMADMNEANYEQLAIALEMANDKEKNVEITREEVQSIVRLILGNAQFDIIPDDRDDAGNLIYDGSLQWEDLTEMQFTTIENWLNANNFTYEAVENSEYGEVDYALFRPRFGYMSSSTALVSGISPVPVTIDTYYNDYASISAMQEKTYAQEAVIAIYKGYNDYIKALYDNREALYDNMDYVSYMYENAAINRSKAVDVTMLEWAINTFKKSYEGNAGLNQKFDGVDSTGALRVTKLYTAGSYENFRVAYDFAKSLIDASANSLLSDEELTQSMASEAFYALLDAFYALIPFTGPADWTQLENYIALANAIIDDPLSYDKNVGYDMEDGQWDIMTTVLADSVNLTKDESIDCERQNDVDDMAAALYQAIYKLNYLTSPDLISNTTAGGEELVNTVVTSSGQTIRGQIFGLKEGVGAIMDLIQVVGMREDEGSGTTVTITGSGRGFGTGAFFVGTVEHKERFRYYAVVYGDINGDARVDGTDAAALEIAAMTSDGAITQDNLGSAAKFEAADANHDGSVDDLDIAKIVDHYTFETVINQKTHSTTIISE